LLDQVVLDHGELELSVVAYALAGGALGRILTLELEETCDFAHVLTCI
jgi:hypothetical protein